MIHHRGLVCNNVASANTCEGLIAHINALGSKLGRTCKNVLMTRVRSSISYLKPEQKARWKARAVRCTPAAA